MDGTLKELQRDFTLLSTGIQETVITIADHVNQHVQKVKLNLETTALEKEIQQDQEALGKKIFEQPEMQMRQLCSEKDIQKLVDRVLIKQRKLESTEEIVSPHEALHDFERLLIQSDFIIQTVVILDGYSGIDKTIEALEPPSQMLIFFIKKQNKVKLAYGSVRISAQDEITFLCSKENTQRYIAFWK